MGAAAVGGLTAMVLTFLKLLQLLWKACAEYGLTVGAARDGLHAMVADFNTRPASYFLGVAAFAAFALFAEYIMLGLVVLGTLVTVLAAIGRWRGLAIEGLLARYLRCPLSVDESHLAPRVGAKAAG